MYYGSHGQLKLEHRRDLLLEQVLPIQLDVMIVLIWFVCDDALYRIKYESFKKWGRSRRSALLPS